MPRKATTAIRFTTARTVLALAARTVLALAALTVALSAACDRPPSSGASASGTSALSAADSALIVEAQAFMSGYAKALAAGDREGIAGRYNRAGAYFLGNGLKTRAEFLAILARYAGPGWTPPAAFEWRDLSFVPAGAEAVVVAGRFAWTVTAADAPIEFSYTALLKRQDGVLRIALEDESRDPRTIPLGVR